MHVKKALGKKRDQKGSIKVAFLQVELSKDASMYEDVRRREKSKSR